MHKKLNSVPYYSIICLHLGVLKPFQVTNMTDSQASVTRLDLF